MPIMADQFSHALAAFAYLVLAALLLRGRVPLPLSSAGTHAAVGHCWWSVAALLTAAWAGAVAGAELPMPAAHAWRQALETLRTAGWLLLLAQLAAASLPSRVRRRSMACLLFAACAPLATQAWQADTVTFVLRLVLAVAGLVLLELLYRAAAPHARWGIRLACLGVGALFVYDVFLYADALLLRRIDGDIHAARGAVNALSVPLLVVALRRGPAWPSRLQLSRRAAARSVALLACSAYLIVMAGAAWYLGQTGGSWGAVMQLACLFGAMLVLLTVLGSGATRAHLKVLVAKHLYRGRYDYRHEWQHFTAGIAAAGADLPRQSIEALAALVESPAGVLWLRSGARQFQPAACWNMAAPQAPVAMDSALCRLLGERAWVVETSAWCGSDAGDRRADMPAWLGSASPFWIITPLLLGERLFGFVGLAPARTPMDVDWEVRDMLVIAGRQAATALAHRESADGLAAARQFAAFHRMSAFVAHDLKNVTGQLSLLLSNAHRHRHDQAFQDDLLGTVQHALNKMERLLVRLGREDAPAAPVALRLDRLLHEMAGTWHAMRPTPVLRINDGRTDTALVWVTADAERLARVFGHLVQNAVEASDCDGSVTVSLQSRHGMALVEVCDTGHGMSAAFMRERLFQPFDTTKHAGMGIGVFESLVYLRELGGDLAVDSKPGAGTTFTASLPIIRPCPMTSITNREEHDGPRAFADRGG